MDIPPWQQVDEGADNTLRPANRALITLPRRVLTPLMLVGLALGGLALRLWLDGISEISLSYGVQLALALLLIPLGYDLARRMLGSYAGLLAAALLALGLPFIQPSAPILREPLFLAIFGAHLWLLVCWRDSYYAGDLSWPWLVVAGVALAVAALLHALALYAVALALGLVAAEVWMRLTGQRRKTNIRSVPTRDHTQFVGIRQPDRFADAPTAPRHAWPVGRWLLLSGGYILAFLTPLALTIALWAIIGNDLPFHL